MVFLFLSLSYALTVLVLRPYCVDKLLATNRELVSILGLLDLNVGVCGPLGNCVQTPLHGGVLPVTTHSSVILVVVQVEDFVAPVLSCGHVLEWSWSHDRVCVLRGRNRLQLLLLFFLWVLLQVVLPELQLGTVNSTP